MKVVWFLMVLAVLGSEGLKLASAAKPEGHYERSKNDDYYDQQPRQHRLMFIEMLMKNPYGVPDPPKPSCLSSGSTGCSRSEDCCVNSNDPQECSEDSTCISACFAGDTVLQVQDDTSGRAVPVKIKNIKTGQHILCTDTNEDLRLPTKASWCEVINWAHAESGLITHHRLSFTRPSGAEGSLTMSPLHMAVKLTSAAAGDKANSVATFGSFDLIKANEVKAGDLMAVLTDESDPEGGFTVVPVTSNEVVQAEGMYVPYIEKPYMVADGVLAGRTMDYGLPMDAPAGHAGIKAAAPFYINAPGWMARRQPAGTEGVAGHWEDKSAMWPGLTKTWQHINARVAAGDRLNFAALQDWFMPRYKRWQADRSDVITIEESFAMLQSGAPIWLKAKEGARKDRKKIQAV